jgi:hypothetical protein
MSKKDQSRKQILERLENYDIFEVIEMAVQQGITCEQMYGYDCDTDRLVSTDSWRLPTLIMDTLDDIQEDKRKKWGLH